MKRLLFILLIAVSHQVYSQQQRDPAVLLNLANNGDAQAQEELGDYYYNNQGREIAIDWWTKAANASNANASYKIGNHYYNLMENNGKAVFWLYKAISQGSNMARAKLQEYREKYGYETPWKIFYSSDKSSIRKKLADLGFEFETSVSSAIIIEKGSFGSFKYYDSITRELIKTRNYTDDFGFHEYFRGYTVFTSDMNKMVTLEVAPGYNLRDLILYDLVKEKRVSRYTPYLTNNNLDYPGFFKLANPKFSTDGRVLSLNEGRKTVFYDTDTGDKIITIRDTYSSSMAISADKSKLLLDDKLYDCKKGKMIKRLNESKSEVTEVWFNNTGEYVAISYGDGFVRIWEIDGDKKPKYPARLQIEEVSFTDSDNNQVIDGEESGRISFTLSNVGKGDAQGLSIALQNKNGLQGLVLPKAQKLSVLPSGQKQTFSFDIASTQALQEGLANFEIQVTEKNGFDAPLANVEVKTRAFIAPKPIFADYSFYTSKGGVPSKGEVINLKVLVQNQSLRIAKGVKLAFTLPENVFAGEELQATLGDLQPNESQEFVFPFFTNARYEANTLPIQATLTESYGKFGQEKTFEINLSQSLSAGTTLQVKSMASTTNITAASLHSDVDGNIPESASKNEHRYAVIIGNEDYSSYQSSLGSEVNVDFAQNDTQVFAQYCQKTLGIPEKQIKVIVNATSGKMKQALNWLKEVTQVDADAEVFFYYSGHGLPDEQTKEAYLMPVDISGSQITEGGLKVSDVYQGLSNSKPKRATVFLDACFSGGARNQPLLARKAARVKPQAGLIQGSMVVFASSSGDESSGVYREKQHGYFTYFLLKKLQETSGSINYKELSDYLTNTVSKETFLSDKKQTPSTQASPEAIGWESWLLK